MLVGSLFGECVLLLTSLLCWYVGHGLVVTDVYEVFQYTPQACYERFGVSVSNARRAGDADPSLALLAETSKLIGNSVYGKTITNKETHRNVMYCQGFKSTSARIRSPLFVGLEEIDHDFYEISSHKRKVGAQFSFTKNIPSDFVSVRNFPPIFLQPHFPVWLNVTRSLPNGLFPIFFKVILDVPSPIGFTVLQYAKLRMLQFYYDFMDK